jgi:hypothetical protein
MLLAGITVWSISMVHLIFLLWIISVSLCFASFLLHSLFVLFVLHCKYSVFLCSKTSQTDHYILLLSQMNVASFALSFALTKNNTRIEEVDCQNCQNSRTVYIEAPLPNGNITKQYNMEKGT